MHNLTIRDRKADTEWTRTAVIYSLGKLALWFFLLHSHIASAALLSMDARQWGEQGNYATGRYIWVNADMRGQVSRDDGSTGEYRVPVTLIYSDKAPTTAGVVDLINSASYQLMRTGIEPIPRNYVTAHAQNLISDYLWRSGVSYIAVQWSKMVTDVRGDAYGKIEDGRDGYTIMADAADFLRQPTSIQGDVPFQPTTAPHIISFSFSQPAFLQWGMYKTGKNRRTDGSLVFDGMLAVVGGLTHKCRALNNDNTPRNSPYFPTHPTYYEFIECPDSMPDDGLFIKLETETEVMTSAAHTRYTNENFRQYEIAGVSHVTPKLMNLDRIGLRDQNYTSSNEFIKASFQLLLDWLGEGKKPPPSVYIDGEMQADGKFIIKRDADGNAVGGIRPPHMIRSHTDSTETIGAPLGNYLGRRPPPGPLNEQPENTSGFWFHLSMIGGLFKAFDEATLRQRYPTPAHYQQRIKAAADALLSEKFLLAEDHRSIISKAAYWNYSTP